MPEGCVALTSSSSCSSVFSSRSSPFCIMAALAAIAAAAISVLSSGEGRRELWVREVREGGCCARDLRGIERSAFLQFSKLVLVSRL